MQGFYDSNERMLRFKRKKQQEREMSEPGPATVFRIIFIWLLRAHVEKRDIWFLCQAILTDLNLSLADSS